MPQSQLASAAALALAVVALAPAARAQGWVRPYYAGGPLALNLTTLQYDLDADVPIDADFDLLVVNADSWGVPWDSMIREEPLPVTFEQKLNASIDAWRRWGRAALLLLPMGDDASKRSCPASNATDGANGLPSLQPVGGCTRCFDYNETTNPVAAFFRQGYVNYVLAMAAAFTYNEPGKDAPLVGVGFAVDANRVLEAGCGAAWLAGYVDFSNQVFATVKNFLPALPLFPAFSLESMYGLAEGQACGGGGVPAALMGAAKPPPQLLACFDANYDAFAAMRRDVFAFTAFPSQFTGGVWRDWYISAALARLDPPVDTVNMWIVGTGVVSDNVVVNAANQTSGKQPKPQCVEVLRGNASDADAWLASVVAAATDAKLQLVTLAYARDVLFSEAMDSCPCAAPEPALQPYCDYINYFRLLCQELAGLPSYICEINAKFFATDGVRDLLNNEKQPIYSTLQAARAATLPAPRAGLRQEA